MFSVRCVTTPTSAPVESMCSSTSRTLRGRPTFTGTTDIGNSTELRKARIGTVFACGTNRSAHIVPESEPTTRLSGQQLVIAKLMAVVRNANGLCIKFAASAQRAGHFEGVMSRPATAERSTRETNIRVALDLDGSGISDIETPLPFLSHMLEQISRHGLIDLKIHAEGDTHIDGHHTTEDLGIAFGNAVKQAVGDSLIRRFGFATIPMDDARASVAVDLSGRPFFVWRVPLAPGKVGTWDSELAEVFFEAVARSAKMNLHVTLETGHNLHHCIEVCFKAFARALRSALEVDPRLTAIPSTKGQID